MYKCIRFLFITIIIILGGGFLSAQSNIDLANKYYDADDYTNAVVYFKKTLFEDKNYNGTVFYRYAYRMEQLNAPKKEYFPFYSAAAYIFEKTNKKTEKYYSYAIAKEEKYHLSHEKYSDETIENLLNEKKVRNQNVLYSKLNEFTEGEVSAILLFYAFLVIIIYLIGRKFSKKTECVIFSSRKEIFLLFLPFFVLIFAFSDESEYTQKMAWTIFIISLCISFIASVIFSVYENVRTCKPVLYTTVSLVTKWALFIITPLVLFLSLFGMKAPEKDRRFRDGTKNNQQTKNFAIVAFILSGLIYSLIKKPKRKIELKNEYI